MPRKPLIAGNWKMHGLQADGRALAQEIAAGARDFANGPELLICPPATLLPALAAVLDRSTGAVALGGQDCHAAAGGAHTGDISAAMLADLGCSHVLVGHSERRQAHGETDPDVAAKAEAAWAAGLVAIICIGESAEERTKGLTMASLSTRLDLSVPRDATAQNTVIAYEPIWAIGSGLAATPADAADAHDHIRTWMKARHDAEMAEDLRILYGGSMKPDNAPALLAEADIDGGLIGGASLVAADFLAIARAAH